MVDLLPDKVLPYWDRLVEVCVDVEKFTVVGFVGGKLRVICVAKSRSQNKNHEQSIAHTPAFQPLQRRCRPLVYARRSHGRSSLLG